MDVQSNASQPEIARVKRVRGMVVELQKIALDLAEVGEADMSSAVLGAAYKVSRVKGRTVDAAAVVAPAEQKASSKAVSA